MTPVTDLNNDYFKKLQQWKISMNNSQETLVLLNWQLHFQVRKERRRGLKIILEEALRDKRKTLEN